MVKEYVEKRNGGYFVDGTRISLDSIIYAFLRGESPEGIVDSFPSLTLEQVFGALTFYLANRESVDKYLREGEKELDLLREKARQKNPTLYSKLRAFAVLAGRRPNA